MSFRQNQKAIHIQNIVNGGTMKKTFTFLMLGALTLALTAFSFLTVQAKAGNGDVVLQTTPVASPVPTDADDGIPAVNTNLADSSVVVWDQFCVRKIPYTILALEPNATYEIATGNAVPTQVIGGNTNQFSCDAAGTFRDKQVIVCHGPQLYTFTLHINGSNGGEDFQVPLKGCPIPRNESAAPQPTAVP
jgi:hypothetical protein